MARATTKAELLAEIRKERRTLEQLLDHIPDDRRLEPVADDLSVKDLLAHRTEWGRMLLHWIDEARRGGTPAVPHERYKWNQLPALNAEIQARYRDTPLDEVVAAWRAVHDELVRTIEATDETELFTPGGLSFVGTTTLAAYVTSATAAHDRSARRLIAKWWRAQAAAA